MSTAVALSSSPVAAPVSTGSTKHSADDDFTFDDLLSIVNPLQHIPVVSTIYRSLTGDTIKPFERIVGDTLYGGVWGCVSAVANVVYQDVTGKDFGQTVLDTALDLVTGTDDDAHTATASNTAPNSSSATSTAAAATAASINPSASTATAQPAPLPAPSTMPAASAASGPPRVLQMPQGSPSTNDAATTALMRAMSSKGIDPTLSQRALSAYKKSLAAPQPPQQQPPVPAVPTS
ncbi:MAG TPA: hypothetical protein VMD53_13065 [Rhizomicrobium sp.]|nr:hypothetical protein [Rhizomicrobium sp.]